MPNNQMNKKLWHNISLKTSVRQAFTLTEVLMTLTLIVIIAGFAIYSITQSIQQTMLSEQAKITYSRMQQAYQSALLALEIDGYGSFTCQVTSGNKKWTAIKSKMKIIKDCNGNTFGNCWASRGIPGIASEECPAFNQANQNNNSAFLTSDGTAVMLYGNDSSESCDSFLIDMNGPNKGPNQLGMDVLGGWIIQNNTIQINPAGCDAGIANQAGMNYITQ
jgi:prepilin-type N-terminal cleavage/methylation domain-containing protein